MTIAYGTPSLLSLSSSISFFVSNRNVTGPPPERKYQLPSSPRGTIPASPEPPVVSPTHELPTIHEQLATKSSEGGVVKGKELEAEDMDEYAGIEDVSETQWAREEIKELVLASEGDDEETRNLQLIFESDEDEADDNGAMAGKSRPLRTRNSARDERRKILDDLSSRRRSTRASTASKRRLVSLSPSPPALPPVIHTRRGSPSAAAIQARRDSHSESAIQTRHGSPSSATIHTHHDNSPPSATPPTPEPIHLASSSSSNRALLTPIRTTSPTAVDWTPSPVSSRTCRRRAGVPSKKRLVTSDSEPELEAGNSDIEIIETPKPTRNEDKGKGKARASTPTLDNLFQDDEQEDIPRHHHHHHHPNGQEQEQSPSEDEYDGVFDDNDLGALDFDMTFDPVPTIPFAEDSTRIPPEEIVPILQAEIIHPLVMINDLDEEAQEFYLNHWRRGADKVSTSTGTKRKQDREEGRGNTTATRKKWPKRGGWRGRGRGRARKK